MAIKQTLAILSNAAGAVTGPVSIASVGGTYLFAVLGTFGGASIQLQILGPDAITWMNLGTAVTAAGLQSIDIPSGANVRAVVTGAGGSALYASLAAIRQ